MRALGFFGNALAALALGAIASAAVWHFYGHWEAPPAADVAAALQRREALQRAVQVAPTPSRPPSVLAAQACAFDPLLARSSGRESFDVGQALALSPSGNPDAFVTVAREAHRDHRLRDAEVALIVACRLAGRAGAVPSVQLADIQEQLARHYVAAAVDPQGAGEIRRRAESLMEASVRNYRDVLGEASSRTRQALEELAALRSGAAAAEPVFVEQREPAPGRDVPAREDDAPPAAKVLAGSDPDLAQLESDLQRLRAQAAAVTTDPAGMQRRTAAAQARRQGCRDNACLLRWYARRRSELLGEF